MFTNQREEADESYYLFYFFEIWNPESKYMFFYIIFSIYSHGKVQLFTHTIRKG